MFFDHKETITKFILFPFLIFVIYVIIIVRIFSPPLKVVKPFIKDHAAVHVDYLSTDTNIADYLEKNLSQNLATDSSNGIIRKRQVFRGTDYFEDVFYQGNKEIARQIFAPDGTVEQSGEIPNGEVKFEDSYDNTYGDEIYLFGRKSGISNTYSNGRLKSKAGYRQEKLLWIKEYFSNGILRSEINYQNARDIDDKEVGVGKLYYPDSTLKYEWNITRGNPGFKKSYNKNGELRAAVYYDETGKIK